MRRTALYSRSPRRDAAPPGLAPAAARASSSDRAGARSTGRACAQALRDRRARATPRALARPRRGIAHRRDRDRRLDVHAARSAPPHAEGHRRRGAAHARDADAAVARGESLRSGAPVDREGRRHRLPGRRRQGRREEEGGQGCREAVEARCERRRGQARREQAAPSATGTGQAGRQAGAAGRPSRHRQGDGRRHRRRDRRQRRHPHQPARRAGAERSRSCSSTASSRRPP